MKPKRAATSRGGDEMREIEVAKVWQAQGLCREAAMFDQCDKIKET